MKWKLLNLHSKGRGDAVVMVLISFAFYLHIFYLTSIFSLDCSFGFSGHAQSGARYKELHVSFSDHLAAYLFWRWHIDDGPFPNFATSKNWYNVIKAFGVTNGGWPSPFHGKWPSMTRPSTVNGSPREDDLHVK